MKKQYSINQFAILFFFLFLNTVLYAQTSFVKYGNNPVLTRNTTFGVWDAIAISDPHVLLIDDTLKMWYTGVGWLSTKDTEVHQRIGYAWSLDGINWNQYQNNPVLDHTADGWDDKGVETPAVIYDPNAAPSEKYKMWYAGQNSTTDIYSIGYAYSPDGFNWTKSNQNPVLQIGDESSWENGYLEGPSVLLVDDTLKMWYASVDLTGDGAPTDFTGNIGYAWSLDGANWTKHPDNPIFTSYNSDAWDQASVADPHVIFKDNLYQMFYAGLNTWAFENFKMGFAQSVDGIHWTRPTATPILETGNAGDWDDEDASYGCALYNPTMNKYQLWYTGLDTNALTTELTGYFYDIGYATADVVTGVDEQYTLNIHTKAYPNPCQNTIRIDAFGKKEIKNLRLFAISGQEIFVQAKIISNEIRINTKNLVPNQYFYTIIFSDNKKAYGTFSKIAPN